jgi:hypothetical protein
MHWRDGTGEQRRLDAAFTKAPMRYPTPIPAEIGIHRNIHKDSNMYRMGDSAFLEKHRKSCMMRSMVTWTSTGHGTHG